MKFHFKIDDNLRIVIIKDLARPHRHAHERVGFLRTHHALSLDGAVILAREYLPVVDEHYIPDRSVGARIDANAIRRAIEWADGWPGGIFHIHKHFGSGVPQFSRDDLDGNARLIPSFFNIAPLGLHGAVVLSDDSLNGAVWTGKNKPSSAFSSVSILGGPPHRWRE